MLLGIAGPAGRQSQSPSGEESPATIRMMDDFRYQIVDYGLGIVETCPSFVRQDDVFWLRIKLTNESEHLLGNPRFFSDITVSDNWGNRY